MTEKEAREIIKQGQSFRLKKDETVNLGEILDRSIEIVQKYAGAEKYLEAIKKAEPLVKALDYYQNMIPQDEVAEKALAQWEKVK